MSKSPAPTDSLGQKLAREGRCILIRGGLIPDKPNAYLWYQVEMEKRIFDPLPDATLWTLAYERGFRSAPFVRFFRPARNA